MLEIGSVVDGKYKVLSKIGQGGMSVVYLALNERANKTWAIKEVRKDGVKDFAAVRQGLMAETSILKRLHHKYLPSIVDIIDDEDTFIIVMDYIQGKSLNKVLQEKLERENLPIAVDDVISWGIQLCDVLYYLHTREHPVIYRDMKPANIMLKPDGEISLIDFGTARIFKPGNSEDTTCLGTPGYAAPEQYGGNGQSCPQSDIYCLGATLHHLITGRNPAASPFHFPPITQCRPTLPEETPRELRNMLLGLEMIISKCTRYEPADRYRSCAELKYDLEHPEGLGLPYRRKLKSKMLAFSACAGMSLLMGIGSLTGSIMARKTEMTGYDYYIESASTAADAEKLKLYKKAIALNPQQEDAWLDILDAVDADNVFTAEEDSYILALLSSRDNGRSQDNRTLFQKNESGYVRFAYELGMLYYYAEGGGHNKRSAGGWFAVVSKTNLTELDLGEDDHRKTAWQARAHILGKISEYNSKIGQTNQAGDAQVTYSDYWKDLMALVDDDIAGKDNIITELRLYNEIVYQICTHYDSFKDDGLSKGDMEQTLAHIEMSVSGLNTADNAVAEELKRDILSAAEIGKKQVEAIFAANAQAKREETKTEETNTAETKIWQIKTTQTPSTGGENG